MKNRERNKGLTTPIGKFLDSLSYGAIGILLLVLILACALYYYLATPYSIGVDKALSFGDAIYFSIITFATVGYGDYVPVHFGRVIAAIEVILGLFFTALFIGKLASERQSRILLLLYTSENQRRLREFSEGIDNLNIKIKNVAAEQNYVELLQHINYTISSLGSFRNFLIFHSNHGELAKFGNITGLRRLYTSIGEMEDTITNIVQSNIVKKEVWIKSAKLILSASSIGFIMVNFHDEDIKSQNLLHELQKKKTKFDSIYNEAINSNTLNIKLLTVELLEKINDSLPPSPWLKNVHKEVANKLGITNSLCHRGINELVKLGKFPSQVPNKNDRKNDS